MILICKAIIAWMIEDEAVHGARDLPTRTVLVFPEHFRAHQKANLVCTARWWALRDTYFNALDDAMPIFISSSQSRLGNRKRGLIKAATGRGQKRSDWMLWLYPRVLEAFDTYRKAGIKFSSKLLIELILSILIAEDSIYHAQSRDPKDDRLLTQKITHCWMQQFMDMYNIVLLSQRSNLSYSPEKERQIEMNTAYHLGVLQRRFQFGVFNENLMENLDETHVTVNMDNSRTLEFRGDMIVKYVDVVVGGDAMTMVIRISGGRRSMVEASMLIFTNGNNNYPIRSLEDTIPRVCYRTGPKGWMDHALFFQYFEEPRAYQPDLYNRTKTIWVDNCTRHNITP
jgi:hypothetical protein